MILRAEKIATGMNNEETKKVIVGISTNAKKELIINIVNGNGCITTDCGSYRSHDNFHTDSIKVIITGGTMKKWEYQYVEKTLGAIYEIIRDGFTVELSGMQKFHSVNGNEIRTC